MKSETKPASFKLTLDGLDALAGTFQGNADQQNRRHRDPDIGLPSTQGASTSPKRWKKWKMQGVMYVHMDRSSDGKENARA